MVCAALLDLAPDGSDSSGVSSACKVKALQQHLAEALACAAGTKQTEGIKDQDPGGAAARKWAARLRCELALQGFAAGSRGGTDAVAASFEDAAYEARKAAAKVLLRAPHQVQAIRGC